MKEISHPAVESIIREFSSINGVTTGKMMSAPALKFNNKVFVFFLEAEMGFRLGPSFSPKKFGLLSARTLSPFKTKPPLKGWYLIDASESDFWSELCALALTYTQQLK